MDELVALAVVDNLWERLEGVRVARAGLGAFHSLIGGEGGGWGLVEQLLGEVYRKEGGDVNGLYHHSQGLGAMLRSGLGWLGSAPSAPHPRWIFSDEPFSNLTFLGRPPLSSSGLLEACQLVRSLLPRRQWPAQRASSPSGGAGCSVPRTLSIWLSHITALPETCICDILVCGVCIL